MIRSMTVAVGLCIGLTNFAQAGTILVSFSMVDTNVPVTQASGTFTYDSSLNGSTIEFGDLLSFNINALGVDYDLAFLNSGGFSSFYYMSFDSVSDQFLSTTIGGFPTILAAIKSSFDAGFFIRPFNDFPVVTEYSTSNFDRRYNQLNISKTELNAVPEPATLASGTLASLAGLALVSRRKRQQAA